MDNPDTKKMPQTRVTPGREREALEEHIRRMTIVAAYRHAQKLLRAFERDERSKRRLLKIIGVMFAGMLGLLLLGSMMWYLSGH
jgi:hypothetical protein